ncbi:MAG: 16S rRNA (adenine(1518)-N(6)/adenine(1519)-N(6))-dimethyltransferase RsmA [Rubrivivax sp.]
MRHVPRKRFGQHFLADESVCEAIVDAVDPRPGQAVVEIGPGLGALTRGLLARCGRLVAVELDRDLAARLRRVPGIELIEADVLRVNVAELARHAGGPLRVVGNLPYNISTPILFHLLGSVQHVHDQHFMLQREVVQRMAAAPGTKAYGRLSVMLQWRYAIEPLIDVGPEAFEPPPAVDSAVVRMQPLPAAGEVDAARLGEIVTLAFSQRRKLLRHTLGAWLERAGRGGTFDTQRRAEEVTVEEYVALARACGPMGP